MPVPCKSTVGDGMRATRFITWRTTSTQLIKKSVGQCKLARFGKEEPCNQTAAGQEVCAKKYFHEIRVRDK